MKMHLMTFDKACEAFDKECHTENNSVKDSVFGIGKYSIPWGENVEVDIGTLNNNNNIPVYELNYYFVPTCMFENLDEYHLTIDVLRYGTILTDNELFDRCDEMAACVQIKVVSYEQAIYYIKMVNGNVEEFKKVGVVG